MSEKSGAPVEWMRAVMWLIVRLVLYGALVYGAVIFVARLRVVIMFLLLAGTLAYVMRPIAGWMSRKYILVPRRCSMHVRRIVTTFYVLVMLFVGTWYAARLTSGPFVRELKAVTDNWGTGQPDDLRPKLDKLADDANAWYGEHVPLQWRQRLEQQASMNVVFQQAQKASADWVAKVLERIGTLLHYVVELVLLPVMAFYLALDSKRIKHEFAAVLPRRRRREVFRIIHQFNQIMYSYVVGQAILCALAGVVVGVGLALLGVKYPLMLGLLAGFTRAIPIIGPIIGGIPIVLLVFATKGLGTALGVLAFFSFLHFAESKFIMPKLIGDRMNLHAVVVIVVLLIGQEFGGLVGMFFGPPVASLLRLLIRTYWIRKRVEQA